MIKKILFGIGAILIALVATGYWSYTDAVISVSTDQKRVALTYDDGPNPPDTQALLEVLDKHQVKATFFMKGRNVEAFPEAVRAVAAAGHGDVQDPDTQNSRSASVTATELIIEALHADGYQITTVGELLKNSRYRIEAPNQATKSRCL